MAACPVCSSEIQIASQHHGTLYTCPSCNAVFFIDWNGQPEGAAEPEPISPEQNPDNGFYSEEPIADFSSPIEDPMAGEEEPVFQPEPQQEEVLQDASPVTSDYDFSQPLGEPMVSPMQTSIEPTPTESEGFATDIIDFGNADLGPSTLNYTITVSGIDSAGLRTQVQEILSDSKFSWNVIQLMSQIKGGVLTIKSVNPVKASILIQRVKYLPVKVSWRQDVLSSTL